jgi:hypothetical protein
MVKTKKVQAMVARPKPNPRRKKKSGMGSVPRLLQGLDEGAREWAQLLADPCNAPLAKPCYPTQSGGMLIRCEWDGIVFSSTTSVAGAVLFTPGFINTVSGQIGSVQFIDSNSDSVGVGFTPSQTAQPGYYTALQWESARAVAACAQVSWPGSELNRQGVISLAQVPASTIVTSVGGLYSIANLRAASPYVERMPDTVAEVKWRPGDADNQFKGVNATQVAAGIDGHNSILITVSGIPVSTGARIRLVAVYEVQFTASSGQIFTMVPAAGPATKYSSNDIFSFLDKAGNWAYSLATSPAAKIAWDVGVSLAKKAPLMLL